MTGSNSKREYSPAEFVQLPFYPWIERPLTLPLDDDECATAIFIAKGDVSAAADLLKVMPARLKRVIRKSRRLQLLLSDLQPRQEG
jgi:hypothetical protein